VRCGQFTDFYLFRYWGTSETLLPVYQTVEKAVAKHPEVDTVVNFASSRSVFSSTIELMNYPQIKSIAIIAEGVPERVSEAMKLKIHDQFLILIIARS
jgi:ATP citrate (pro-S)-lyase